MKKNKTVKVYKVVSRNITKYGPGKETSTYRSAVAAKLPKKWTLPYRVGKTTKPKVGKIMAFDDCYAARRFMYQLATYSQYDSHDSLGFHIMECEAKPSKQIGQSAYLSNGAQLGDSKSIPDHDLSYFWKSIKNQVVGVPIKRGTVYCDSIKPIQIIQ